MTQKKKTRTPASPQTVICPACQKELPADSDFGVGLTPRMGTMPVRLCRPCIDAAKVPVFGDDHPGKVLETLWRAYQMTTGDLIDQDDLGTLNELLRLAVMAQAAAMKRGHSFRAYSNEYLADIVSRDGRSATEGSRRRDRETASDQTDKLAEALLVDVNQALRKKELIIQAVKS